MTRLAWFVLPSLAFVGVLTVATLRGEHVARPGDAAPEFEAPRLSGDGSLALSDLRGKPVLINFWWSGCEPCKEEAPLLSEAQDAYGDRVTFLGVNIKDARSDALAFVDEMDLDYAHVRDEGFEIYRDYGLTGQPETFFVDADGTVLHHVAGPVSESSLYDFLDVLVRRHE